MTDLKNRSSYAISTDCAIFAYSQEELKVALIQRKNLPYKGKWAIPGGFIEGDETLEEGAARELFEETHIKDVYLEQFHCFSAPKRDPRGRVITVAFFALVNPDHYEISASADAEKVQWWEIHNLPPLAFDHQKMMEMALESLKKSITLNPIGFELLPKEFTLSQFQKLYEILLEKSIDKRNFRKKISRFNFIKETGKVTEGDRHRPAKLYSFDSKKYKRFSKEGFYFDL
ncbi:MAG: 8-oxo-dGTP diphosphatase [Chlamydiales bacterium]|jgi:8-oxo-dGTP diphosphatase